MFAAILPRKKRLIRHLQKFLIGQTRLLSTSMADLT